MTSTRLEPRTKPRSACTEALLDISTGHIRPETREWITNDLASQDGYLSGTNWSEYGWILWVNEDACYLDDIEGAPSDLAQVMEFARAHGYRYLKLDCDACYIAGLPIYDDEE